MNQLSEETSLVEIQTVDGQERDEDERQADRQRKFCDDWQCVLKQVVLESLPLSHMSVNWCFLGSVHELNIDEHEQVEQSHYTQPDEWGKTGRCHHG